MLEPWALRVVRSFSWGARELQPAFMFAAFFAASPFLVVSTASAQTTGEAAPSAAAEANTSQAPATAEQRPLGANSPSAISVPETSGAPAVGSSTPPGPVSSFVSPPIEAWSAPDGCPAAHSVDARARSLAGVDAATWASAGSVRGRISAEGGGWVLSLQIERAPGSGLALAAAANARSSAESSPPPARVFHAGDCGELGEAAAVAIALALGGAAAAPPAGADDGVESVPTPPAADETQDTAGLSLASELHSIGAVARAEALVDTGSLGGLAFGASVEVGMRWRALGLRAYGVGLPSRQVRLASSQYVELSLWAAGLRACYRAADALPLIDVCGGAEVGAFGAAGRGLVDARERRDAWGATTWGTWFGIDLAEHLQAGARLEAVVPLSRERYFVNRNELVHEMSGAGVRLALSLGGTLGSD
jgi:hypothetical protein